MAIPNNPLFEDFISKVRVLERSTASSVLFRTGEGPTFYLDYPTTELPLDAVLRAISRELDQHGCASDREIALATLGLLATTRSEATAAVEHANRCFSRLHNAELFQYLVLPTHYRAEDDAVFEDFRIGRFNPEKLLYWSRRGISRYPVDLGTLSGRTTLERERFPTQLINWDELPVERTSDAYAKGEELFTLIRDAYYQAVFNHHLLETSIALRRSIRVLEAGALLHFDIESFMQSLLAQRIGLFHWQHQDKHRTWAVLSSIDAMNFNLPNTALLAEIRRWLKDVIGFTKLDLENPFDRTVDMFCILLQRAHEHRLNGRGDEAALHFVIALDALLGTETRSAESVAVRTAVITHIPFARSLQDQIRRIKTLYDSRSKYVHEGREMPVEAVQDAERVATEVLWALLAVCGARKLVNTAQWLTRIDYVAAALKDGRQVPDEEFIALGIAHGANGPRIPPNRVLEDVPQVMLDIRRIALPRYPRTK